MTHKGSKAYSDKNSEHFDLSDQSSENEDTETITKSDNFLTPTPKKRPKMLCPHP